MKKPKLDKKDKRILELENKLKVAEPLAQKYTMLTAMLREVVDFETLREEIDCLHGAIRDLENKEPFCGWH